MTRVCDWLEEAWLELAAKKAEEAKEDPVSQDFEAE